MRRDPFENQADLSGYPECIACISYCPMQTPWKDPEGRLKMMCGSPVKRGVRLSGRNGKEYYGDGTEDTR